MRYVELHARSAFSFLRGGSNPEQLAQACAQLGMPAMALCDRDGVYGAPRFAVAAAEQGIRAIVGSELTMEDGSVLPVLVETREGYRNLCRLITRSKLRGTKTESAIRWEELPEFARGLVCLTGDEEGPLQRALAGEEDAVSTDVVGGISSGGREQRSGRPLAAQVENLCSIFGRDGVYVELQRHLTRGEDRRVRQLVELGRAHGLPLLATNGVLYAQAPGRAVLDVFTCARHHTHLDLAGKLLAQNDERYVKNAAQMQALFHDVPEALENTVALAERLRFSLDDLGYQFPAYPVPEGESMESFLRKIVMAGARARYSHLSQKVLRQLNKELALINKLGFPGYFLIVWDIVNFCTENNIMVQGRGSAANSAVCYSLGITPVDPVGSHLLFERFLSEGRKGWPDIDLDLPSGERRESVIQEVYQRYGKLGAAMTANVITYRGKSAMREIGKALNFAPDVMDRFSRLFAAGDFPHTLDLQHQMAQAGIPLEHPRAPAFVSLYTNMYGLPRHLGQHSGGMIICQGQLDSIVPLENASMPGRVVAQWDKEDCEELGIIKVDLLGLGMMSVMQDTIELCAQRGASVDLAQIPKDDAATYEMMQKADTIGVFQIESRAQMATLPRMKPKVFYDVVIEVAIIRPGPIQGDMVHPYLARRAGKEPVKYFDDRLKPVLERTLGVPLFQEQMLKIAMVMADFSGDEAEELRRALSFHRSTERMERVGQKLRAGMDKNDVKPEVIEQILASITSFALYGFPESHAISFAILAYGSAWLKVHRAPEFYASLLNNQPMGFYSSATLVRDARSHGVKVRPVCVERSQWRCTVCHDDSIRLGFCVIKGLRHEHAQGLVTEREQRPFASISDLKARTTFSPEELRTLAELGALNRLAQHRRDALWQTEMQERPGELFSFVREDSADGDEPSPLPSMTAPERLNADYRGMSLTTGPHPMSLLRAQLPDVWRAKDLEQARHGQTVRIAGNVICRQRPGTAKGFVFLSLEDETGVANAIVSPQLFENFRLLITEEPFLIIQGIVQNPENVVLIRALEIEALPHQSTATADSHDFH